MDYLLITLSAMLGSNIVLTSALGVNSLLGASKNMRTSLSVTLVSMMVMLFITIAIWLLQTYALQPYGIAFLQTMILVLLVIMAVPFFIWLTRLFAKSLGDELEGKMTLIVLNTAIMGVALLIFQDEMTLLQSILFAVGASLGYGLISVLVSAIRWQLQLAELPSSMKGAPILLVVLGIIAMAFTGFMGVF